MNDRLLRYALLLDGAVCALNAVAYLALATVLSDLLGLPAGLLWGAGGFLVLYAAMVLYAGTRKPAVPRVLAWLAVDVNAVWAAISLLGLAIGWFDPTTIGTVWIVLQALVVLGLGVAQYVGIRRTAIATTDPPHLSPSR